MSHPVQSRMVARDSPRQFPSIDDNAGQFLCQNFEEGESLTEHPTGGIDRATVPFDCFRRLTATISHSRPRQHLRGGRRRRSWRDGSESVEDAGALKTCLGTTTAPVGTH